MFLFSFLLQDSPEIKQLEIWRLMYKNIYHLYDEESSLTDGTTVLDHPQQ